MKHAAHKGKGLMPPKKYKGNMPEKEMAKTHMMPSGKEMPGASHPTGRPALKPKRKR